MELSVKYRKTSKGQEVSPTRPHGLAWPMRFALMLIDGQRSRQDVNSMMSSHFEESMQSLLDGGFIEGVPDTPQSPHANGAAADPPRTAAAIGPSELALRKCKATSWLSERAGPEADHLNIRIERAATLEDFERVLLQGRRFVRGALGSAGQHEFDAQVLVLCEPQGKPPSPP